MEAELRLILFVQIYSIYFKIIEESPSKILHIYHNYAWEAGDCLKQKDKESERMRTFILYGRLEDVIS